MPRGANLVALNLRHGMKNTREYKSWTHMIGRCCNPTDRAYRHYGGRGIRVCDRWRASFEAFYADMGPKPPGLTLERIDVNGHYEPANCKWASVTAQARNRRSSRVVTYRGERMCLAEACDRAGLPYNRVQRRLELGWSEERALCH